MADIVNQIDEFKEMLVKNSIPYVELPMSTLFINTGEKINIRQYHEDFCLSSWVDSEEFKTKVGGLIYGK